MGSKFEAESGLIRTKILANLLLVLLSVLKGLSASLESSWIPLITYCIVPVLLTPIASPCCLSPLICTGYVYCVHCMWHANLYSPILKSIVSKIGLKLIVASHLYQDSVYMSENTFRLLHISYSIMFCYTRVLGFRVSLCFISQLSNQDMLLLVVLNLQTVAALVRA